MRLPTGYIMSTFYYKLLHLKSLRYFLPFPSGYIVKAFFHYLHRRKTFKDYYDRLLKDADIGHFTFHALRHTFATRCVEVGFEIKSLSEILGHASPRFTLERYVHASLDLKRDNMNKLAAIGY